MEASVWQRSVKTSVRLNWLWNLNRLVYHYLQICVLLTFYISKIYNKLMCMYLPSCYTFTSTPLPPPLLSPIMCFIARHPELVLGNASYSNNRWHAHLMLPCPVDSHESEIVSVCLQEFIWTCHWAIASWFTWPLRAALLVLARLQEPCTLSENSSGVLCLRSAGEMNLFTFITEPTGWL